MIESIQELRESCQSTRIVYGVIGNNWIGENYNKVSIYLTWVLLHTGITANQVSLSCIFLAIFAGWLISLGSIFSVLFIIVLFLINVLDHVDGEIARYRHTASDKGTLLDTMVDGLIHPFLFIGFGIACFSLYAAPVFLVLCSFVIVCFFVNGMVKIFSKEYQTKEFHTSPSKSISLIFKSPKSLIVFLGSSKHFTDLLCVFSVLFSFYWLPLVFLGVFLPLSFVVRVKDFWGF